MSRSSFEMQSKRECKAGSFFLFRPGINSKPSKTSKTRDRIRRNRSTTSPHTENDSDRLETSLPSDSALYPGSSSSSGPQALTLIREQTSVPSPIDNDHAYHNPSNNPLSSEIADTLPNRDCTTPPFTAKPGSLYLDRPIGQAIDNRAAELSLHFKTIIAKPWFEVTDPDFTNEALRRAPGYPLLLYSLLAVSSSHESRFLDDPVIAQDYARYGEEYHEKCISLLLPMLNDSESITDGAFLACSTILRWCEELSAPIHGRDDARHLLGGYASVAESFRQDLPWEGFRRAALWIHLRQDIFNAVINQRVPRTNVNRLRIDRSCSPADETTWAKRVLCLEAKVVEYCFGHEGSPIQNYETLEARLEDWDRQKPQTFTPVFYQERDPSQGLSFPNVSVLLDSCDKNITFPKITVWSRFFKSSAACQRDDVLGPLAVSATESLQTALLKLGYDHTYHGWDIVYETPNYSSKWVGLCRKKWFGSLDGNTTITKEEFDEILGHSVAVTDAAASVFAAELIAAYPDAKVVLNYRKDLDAWHESAVKTLVSVHENWALCILSCLGKVPFWGWHVYERFMWPGLFRALDGNIETGIARNGKWVYKEHCNMIRGLVPKEKLLEWTVEDGWEPLCKFLDKPVPDEPFPHVNKASGWEKHEAEVTKRYLMSALSGVAVLSAVGIATGAIAHKTMW
ncbi:ARCA-like protein [Fusarium denticulatum]|uniref:ARCA-like protein n=1 Tax=Fusarium denticulatum TaxID=48507 RepID=A0A8H5XKB2_9HYPO|nr:ARCA-like protein [Fusarium denticulatum]